MRFTFSLYDCLAALGIVAIVAGLCFFHPAAALVFVGAVSLAAGIAGHWPQIRM